MIFLTQPQRKGIRASLKQFGDARDVLQQSLLRHTPPPPSLIRRLTPIVGSPDPEAQLRAVIDVRDEMELRYHSQLRDMAHDDLTAFAEYMNPDEPPADWHVWLCDKLMRMEAREEGYMRMAISTAPGHAKALALDTEIPTPSGYTTIADLKVGDIVYSNTGKPIRVTHKSQIFENRRTFRVTTQDGQSIVCDQDHLWNVRLCRKQKHWSNRTTLWLFDRQDRILDKRRVRIPDFSAVEKPEADLPIDPYVLGYWLGDGDSSAPAITIGAMDKEESLSNLRACGVTISERETETHFGLLGIRHKFTQLNLLCNKHIPSLYLNSSIRQRMELLRGLMDSDGSSSPKGELSWLTIIPKLRDDMSTLLYSLGVKHTFSEERATLYGKDCGPCYRTVFYMHDAFKLKRKLERGNRSLLVYDHRYIWIEEVAPVPTQCISVDSDNGLFLAGRGHIVTHNSTYSSRLFPAWYMGRNVKHRYIQAGHTQNFCETEFGKKTKAIVDSERYRDIFPTVALAPDSKAAGYWALAQSGGSYLTRGVGQGIAGFRAHCSGVDDPFATREDAESQTIRDKVFDWFSADFSTRLLPYAPMFVVACLTGETPVLMEGGYAKRLDTVRVGDRVATYNNGMMSYKNVTAFIPQGRDKVFKIKTGQSTVRANARHPFLVERPSGALEWVKVVDLKKGDLVVTSTYSSRSPFTSYAIMSIEEDGEDEVYDLSVEGDENFIVDGLVCHNTRWHSDDLIGRIEEMNDQHKGLPWYIINLPALATEDDPLGREPGEPLWPEFYTLDHLLNLQATLPARDWNSLYMGKPVDEEGGVIKGTWFQRYGKLPEHNHRIRCTLSVDSATKTGDRHDYTAIGVWIEDDQRNHYLAHVHRERMELPALITRIDGIASVWNVQAILVEDKGSGTQYIQTQAGKAPAPIIAISVNNNSKEFRLDGVAPMFEGGKVYLPDRAGWLPAYEAELLGFPNAKYDDQVDMTSQYLNWARVRESRGTKKLGGLAVSNHGQGQSAKALQEIERLLSVKMDQLKDDPIASAIAAALNRHP